MKHFCQPSEFLLAADPTNGVPKRRRFIFTRKEECTCKSGKRCYRHETKTSHESLYDFRRNYGRIQKIHWSYAFSRKNHKKRKISARVSQKKCCGHCGLRLFQASLYEATHHPISLQSKVLTYHKTGHSPSGTSS